MQKRRKFEFKKKFAKKFKKLKGKELNNVINKIDEILICLNINHYKNLRYDFKFYKRVHVNSSFVILFYDEEDKIIHFVDYEHHNKVYNNLN